MAKKKDPSVTLLNQSGYNVVKLPRVGIEPMDVIGKDDTTQWLGPLRSVWKSSVSEPTPAQPQPVPQFTGQKTNSLGIQSGIKLLANVLKAFGATVPSLDIAYQKAASVRFSYTNVMSTGVAPFEAGDYLTKGTLNTASPVVKHYFQSEDAQAFLIVSVLKSDAITVTASDDHSFDIGVDVPAIQGAVGASVKVTSSGANNTNLTYSGTQPVTFGFLANEIEFDGQTWSIRGVSQDNDISFGLGATASAPPPPPVLLSTGCLVRL